MKMRILKKTNENIRSNDKMSRKFRSPFIIRFSQVRIDLLTTSVKSRGTKIIFGLKFSR